MMINRHMKPMKKECAANDNDADTYFTNESSQLHSKEAISTSTLSTCSKISGLD